MIASSLAFSCTILAILKTYFALSFAGIFFQTFSYAFLAAETALSTSATFASAISLNFSSVAGLMVSKYLLPDGFTHSPFIKRSYSGLILAAPLLSGAGAYCQVSNFSLMVLFFLFEIVFGMHFFIYDVNLLLLSSSVASHSCAFCIPIYQC